MSPDTVISNRNTLSSAQVTSSPSIHEGRTYTTIPSNSVDLMKFFSEMSLEMQQNILGQMKEVVAQSKTQKNEKFLTFLKDFRKPDLSKNLQPNYRILQVSREELGSLESFKNALIKLLFDLNEVQLEDLRQNCLQYFELVDAIEKEENPNFSFLDLSQHFDLLHAVIGKYQSDFIQKVADSLKEKLLNTPPYEIEYPIQLTIQRENLFNQCSQLTDEELLKIARLIEPGILLSSGISKEFQIKTLIEIPDDLFEDWWQETACRNGDKIPNIMLNYYPSGESFCRQRLKYLVTLCEHSQTLSEKIQNALTVKKMIFQGSIVVPIIDFFKKPELLDSLIR